MDEQDLHSRIEAEFKVKRLTNDEYEAFGSRCNELLNERHSINMLSQTNEITPQELMDRSEVIRAKAKAIYGELETVVSDRTAKRIPFFKRSRLFIMATVFSGFAVLLAVAIIASYIAGKVSEANYERPAVAEPSNYKGIIKATTEECGSWIDRIDPIYEVESRYRECGEYEAEGLVINVSGARAEVNSTTGISPHIYLPSALTIAWGQLADYSIYMNTIDNANGVDIRMDTQLWKSFKRDGLMEQLTNSASYVVLMGDDGKKIEEMTNKLRGGATAIRLSGTIVDIDFRSNRGVDYHFRSNTYAKLEEIPEMNKLHLPKEQVVYLRLTSLEVINK